MFFGRFQQSAALGEPAGGTLRCTTAGGKAPEPIASISVDTVNLHAAREAKPAESPKGGFNASKRGKGNPSARGLACRFVGDAGERLTVRLPEAAALSEEDAINRAKEMMVQLTPFGTRGGEPSLNRYDSLSNGNFDDDQPPFRVKH